MGLENKILFIFLCIMARQRFTRARQTGKATVRLGENGVVVTFLMSTPFSQMIIIH